ncbi:type II secretion system protein [Massilia suwonensis]|uniref:Type II secretion system protein n=1 Tax=Massilia suwonensis TaxID=648895 RepID=A0ABW0MS34_9BURK
MVARHPRRVAGFTYVGLIVFVAILGMVGAATVKVDSLLRRAAAEQELLEIGAAYSAALRSYAAATPKGYTPVPPTLQDLLKDPRFPGTRRHLRKIFVDPITGGTQWGIVYQGENVGVLAVYSLSQAKPLKVANFDARFPHFENREHLSEWKFSAAEGVPVTPVRPPLVSLPPPRPETPPVPAAVPPAAPADAPAAEPEPAPAQPEEADEAEEEKETAPPPPPDTASGT